MSRISFLQDLLTSVFTREEVNTNRDDDRTVSELCDALLSERGEVSGNNLATTLLARFATADDDGRREYFDLLSSRFDINAEHALRAAQHYANDNSAANLSILMESVEPRRQELLRRLNRVPGATGALVQMREHLLNQCAENSEYYRIDLDFQHLFDAWFNRGFLVLREIDWHTPANILEKIIAYEAVHAINSWSALRTRLKPSDRKCFAFFHPAMLDEPLIFVEVALTQSNPTTIRSILIDNRERVDCFDADTAVFYSISNCQRGLAGVSFGNFLIKQVARELSNQLPNLQTFRTLSPVPGFIDWLDKHRAELTDTNWLNLLEPVMRFAAGISPELDEIQTEQLSRLVAHYLVEQRRDDEQPLNAVARFHLGNGASLDQVLPAADLFDKGLKQSAGVMVSYLYDLDRINQNHQAYASQREIATSSDVAALLTPIKPAKNRANG